MYNIGKNYILSGEPFNISVIKNHNVFDFLRGYIELNSHIIMPNNNINCKNNKPIFYIYFRNKDKELMEKIVHYIRNNLEIIYSINIQIKNYNKIKYNFKLIFENNHVLNILSKIYYINVNKNEIDEYLYNAYMNLSNYKYIYLDSDNDTLNYILPKCYFKTILSSAIPPYKKLASNIGYNITLINRYKTISINHIIYDTGIQLIPKFGYYFEFIPSFKLSLLGYMLSNSISIINKPKKNQTLLISLIKFNLELSDIQLPLVCGKIILKEMIHYELEQIN